MRPTILASFIVLVLPLTAFGQVPDALSLAPDMLRHYHVLPRFSTVRETGGFAGVDNLYRARGEYDFLRLFDHGRFTARFDDAEIWGTPKSDGPAIAIVLDVDEVLNLEGLKGEWLPTLNPFADVYRFKGQTPDLSTVELYAYQRGPWMYLRGGTDPPPNSADYLQYEIRALARSRPWADSNGDGKVNLADYTAIRDQLDSDTHGVTLTDWRNQFGETAPNMAEFEAELFAVLGAGTASNTLVPEPGSLSLLAVAMFLVVVRRTTSAT